MIRRVLALALLLAATTQAFGQALPVIPTVNGVNGGLTQSNRTPSSAATTNLTTISGGAHRVYKVRACNTTASMIFLKFYNNASPTVGTTAIIDEFGFPANQCASYDYSGIGFSYSTAISFATTANAVDSDTTAIGAGALVMLEVVYQ